MKLPTFWCSCPGRVMHLWNWRSLSQQSLWHQRRHLHSPWTSRCPSRMSRILSWICDKWPGLGIKAWGLVFLASKVVFSWPSVDRFGKNFGGLMTLGQVKSIQNFCKFGPQRAEKHNFWREQKCQPQLHCWTLSTTTTVTLVAKNEVNLRKICLTQIFSFGLTRRICTCGLLHTFLKT